MFVLKVEKECGCFRKSNLENNRKFESKDDALIEAQHMSEIMNSEFCGKHNFTFIEDGENFTIHVEDKKREHSGCCGGGHCS